MKPRPLSFVSLALLVFAGWQMVGTLSRTPAFNAALHVEGADGRDYTGYAPAMYGRAGYYRWMASGWAGQGATDDPAAMAQRLQRLRDIATESLKFGPGDPSTWMYLAEAQAGLGAPEAALAALNRSYDLAPQNVTRAVARIAFLTRFMEDPQAQALVQAELDPGRVESDLKLLAEDKYLVRIWTTARDRLIALGVALTPLQGS